MAYTTKLPNTRLLWFKPRSFGGTVHTFKNSPTPTPPAGNSPLLKHSQIDIEISGYSLQEMLL